MSVLVMTLNWIKWWSSSNAAALENAEYSFIAIAPLRSGVVEPERVLSMGQIWHLNWAQTDD